MGVIISSTDDIIYNSVVTEEIALLGGEEEVLFPYT